jgi:hypothetical protein
LDRRRVLTLLGALGVTGLAGCGGDGDDTPTDTGTSTGGNGNGNGGTPTEGETPTETEGETPTETEGGTPTETEGETPTETEGETPTETPMPVFSDNPAPLLSLDGSARVKPGGTGTVTGTMENPYLFAVTNGEFTIEFPDGAGAWSASAVTGTAFETLESQAEQTAEWELTAPEEAESIDATVAGTYNGPDGQDTAEVSIPLSATVFTPGDAPQEGLEAYYPLDGDAATNVITGTDATEEGSGSPTKNAGGVVGDAWEFSMDGTTSDRNPGIADALVSGDNLPLNGEGVTVGAWFRYSEHEPYARVYQVGGGLDSGQGVGGAPGFETTFIDEGNDIRIYNTGGTTGASLTLTPDTWYFVVSVLDGDDARLHVFDASGEIDDSPATGSSNRDQSDAEPLLLMAGDQAETTGRIDEVRAYSRALSEEEVLTLYEGSN